MSAEKLPQVTKYIRNSEESDRRIKEFLNMKSGFICRTDTPDYGSDLEIELMNSNQSATNRKFSIQVKATEKPKFIHKGTLLSYPIEIKTINYLNRPPAYGIIVLYDQKKRRLYFEYIDEIIAKIEERKEDENWRDQDEIMVHIPVKNVLNAAAASRIHQIMTHRFEQSILLHQSHGQKYGIPVIENTNGDFKYDFNNLDHLKKLVKEHGMQFISQYDISFIYDILVKIPHAELYEDKGLLITAAITYSEVGYCSDSELFVAKIIKKHKLQQNEKVTIDFVHLKNQLNLGKITTKDYLDSIKLLEQYCEGKSNKIVLRLNIIYFQLTLHKIPETLSNSVLSEIDSVYNQIEELNSSDTQKNLLKLWNTDNLSLYTVASLAQDLNWIQKIGLESIPIQERELKAKYFISLNDRLLAILREMETSANQSNDMLLKAYVVATQARYILAREIEKMSYEIKPSQQNKGDENLLFPIITARKACQEFMKHKHYYQAYNLLVYQIELIYISRNQYGLRDSFDIQALLDWKKSLETEFDLPYTKSIVLELIKEIKKNKELQNGLYALKDCDDKELERYAKKEMDSGKYPNAKYEYILAELRGYRAFHQRCPSSNLELHVELVNDKLKYTKPPKFIIHSKNTGVNSLPNESIDTLITSWGY